jgi:hypothetical protein
MPAPRVAATARYLPWVSNAIAATPTPGVATCKTRIGLVRPAHSCWTMWANRARDHVVGHSTGGDGGDGGGNSGSDMVVVRFVDRLRARGGTASPTVPPLSDVVALVVAPVVIVFGFGFAWGAGCGLGFGRARATALSPGLPLGLHRDDDGGGIGGRDAWVRAATTELTCLPTTPATPPSACGSRGYARARPHRGVETTGGISCVVTGPCLTPRPGSRHPPGLILGEVDAEVTDLVRVPHGVVAGDGRAREGGSGLTGVTLTPMKELTGAVGVGGPGGPDGPGWCSSSCVGTG